MGFGSFSDVEAVSGWPDRQVAELAARQRGLLTKAQLLALDISPYAIDRALGRGRLHRVHRGVYAVMPLSGLPPLAPEHAAILACGRQTYISHHSAAGILRIRPPHTGDVEVTVVGRDMGRGRAGLIVHRAQVLDARDIRSREGLPVISAALTVIDIAPDLSEYEVELALNEALVRKLMTVWQLRHVLDRYPNRAGSARIRMQIVHAGAGVPQPGAEKALLPHLLAAGMPRPLVNHKLGRWRPDLYWPEARLAVELDGLDFHSTRPRLERDHRKDQALKGMEIEPLRFTGRQVKRELPYVLVTIARAYERRREDRR
jgi:very-short-patch-repair endonuclease